MAKSWSHKSGDASSSEFRPQDVIACLEFLAEEALKTEQLPIYTILKDSIKKVATTNEDLKDVFEYVDKSDILNAVKFFHHFSLIEDQQTRKKLLNLMETLAV